MRLIDKKTNIKSLSNTIFDNVRWAYMHSPVNLSSLTGYRFPHISRLKGNFLTGRLEQSSKDHGLGNSIDITVHAGELAKQDPRGMCYWWIGNQLVILVTQPNDINQIFFKNKDNVSRSELIKDSLGIILGHETVLTMPSNDKWRKKRAAVKKAIYFDEALARLAKPMQEIIDQHLNQIPKEGSVDLRKFSIALPLDVMSITQIGTGTLKDAALHISTSFENVFAQTLDNSNIAKQKIAAFADFFHARSYTTPLEQAKTSLHQMLKEYVLKPYGKQIQNNNNLIIQLAQAVEDHEKKHQLDLNNEGTLSEMAFLMLAGHDTTSRLLEHTLMLLIDTPNVLNKLTDEINKHRPASGEWSKNDIEKMPYIKMVLQETLRLYPSVPLIARTVTKQFVIADIPKTANLDEYDQAMQNRDTTQDVLLQAGDIIIISPFITQRMEAQFENPLQFNPDRFEKKIDPCAWFPFSIGERDCIGRRFALQEASLILIKIIERYTFSLKEKTSHPFTEIMLGTLKPKTPSQVFFKPRKNDEQDVVGISERIPTSSYC